MAKKNVLTGVVVALALVLVVIVVLVKTGVFNSVPQKTTAVETVIESAVVVASETNEACPRRNRSAYRPGQRRLLFA